MYITVHIEEEYGYCHWLWETGMTSEELKSFWKKIESIERFSFDRSKLTEIYEIRDEQWASDDPGPVRFSKTPWDEIEEQSSISMEDVWFAHVHMECDSYLLPKDEESLITHAGWKDDVLPSKVEKPGWFALFWFALFWFALGVFVNV